MSIINPTKTPPATNMITIGYIMAAFTRPLMRSIRSKNRARRSKTVSSTPPASPAFTMLT